MIITFVNTIIIDRFDLQMICNAMLKNLDHHDYHPHNHDYHPGPPTAWRELRNGGRAPHRVLRVANLLLSFYHYHHYHHPIISIYHQCHHQTGPGSWLSPRSSLWHIINDQSTNDWHSMPNDTQKQYYRWANEPWLSSTLPILVLSSLFSFSWAELRPLSSSCLKRWCVLPSRSLRTFALPDSQLLWLIHVTTLTNTYNCFAGWQ